MYLVEIVNQKLTVTTYYSSSGTISDPVNNINDPKPTVATYNVADIYTRIYDSPRKDILGLTIRTIEFVLIEAKHPVAIVNSENLDTNSTNYNSDMNSYYSSIEGSFIVGATSGGASSLNELTDVTITTPLNDQFIRYNGVEWVNETVNIIGGTLGGASTLDELLDTNISVPTDNQFLRYTGSEWVNETVVINDYTSAGLATITYVDNADTNLQNQIDALESATTGINNSLDNINDYVKYDANTDTYFVDSTLDGQTQNIGQEVFFIAKNNNGTGAGTLDPKLFLSIGSDLVENEYKEVILASANDLIEGSIFGINTTSLQAGQKGKVTTYGIVNDVNTSTWNQNDILYADTTVGGLTNVKPSINSYTVGTVLESNSTSGKIFVNSINSHRIDDSEIVVGIEPSFFTADDISTTAGVFYKNLIGNEGTNSVAIEQVTVGDNQKLPISKDHLSESFPIPLTIFKGLRDGQIEFEIDAVLAQEKIYVEIYLSDFDGTPLDSGIVGEPVGTLGVKPIVVLSTALLNISATGAIRKEDFRGFLAEDFALPANHRLRFRFLCEKVGDAGGNKTFTLYFGADHDSFINTVVSVTTDDITNASNILGITLTNALNSLDTRIDTLEANSTHSPDYTTAGLASTSALSSYLPLAGGTLTGDLFIDKASGDEKIALVGSGSTVSPQLSINAFTSTGTIFQSNHNVTRFYLPTTGTLLVQSVSAGKTSAVFDVDAEVGLRFNSVTKFETTNTGISINGEIKTDSITTNNSATDILVRDTDGVFKVRDVSTIGGGTAGGTSTVIVSNPSTPYVPSNNEIVLWDTTSGNKVINLPSASTSTNFIIRIKKADATINTLTINGDGSDTIDGNSSVTLTGSYHSLTIICDGTNWFII
jgi:hypothetical protein